mgnify:CR=1 FL=1
MSDKIELDDPLAYWRERDKIKEQVDRDPLAPGITHGGRHISDVTKALNTLIHRDNYRKVTIEVEAEKDDYHISFTVKERK